MDLQDKHKPKRGAPFGNRNAIGNKGGAPFGNRNAEKHGLFENLAYRYRMALYCQSLDQLGRDDLLTRDHLRTVAKQLK